MTVGEIRKAVEGLPDEAGVILYLNETEDSEGSAFIELKGFASDEGRLAVCLEYTVADFLDDDEFEEDDE